MPDMTFKQLQQDVAQMAKDVTRSGEAIHARGKQIDDAAKDTARVAEMIAGMRVDPATVAETTELARITSGVSDGMISYASAGDTTAKSALAAHEQGRASHSGIQEAVNRSNVSGIHEVNREWLRQD